MRLLQFGFLQNLILRQDLGAIHLWRGDPRKYSEGGRKWGRPVKCNFDKGSITVAAGLCPTGYPGRYHIGHRTFLRTDPLNGEEAEVMIRMHLFSWWGKMVGFAIFLER